MSSYSKKKKAETDAEGWIQKRPTKYGFAKVTHTTRNLKSPRRQITTPTSSESLNKTHLRIKNPYKTSNLKLEQESNVISPVKKGIIKSPTPLNLIRKENHLYFSYDPRGYKTEITLPEGYCQHCRCPDEYCAEIVFGTMSYNRAETMVYTPGNHDTEDQKQMKQIFDNAYSDCVMDKLRWNGFDLNHKDADASWRGLRVPKCVKRNSMKKFLKTIEDDNDKNHDVMFNGYLDYNESDEEEELKKKGEWNTEHPIMKRTAMEQSQDISLMFQKIKKVAKMKEEAINEGFAYAKM